MGHAGIRAWVRCRPNYACIHTYIHTYIHIYDILVCVMQALEHGFCGSDADKITGAEILKALDLDQDGRVSMEVQKIVTFVCICLALCECGK